MRPLKLIAMLSAALVQAASIGAADAGAQANVSARLLASTSAVVPGREFLLGVHLTIEKGWHVYWKNPGEAGLPTQVQWQLPEGFKAGPLRWPVPIRFTMPGDITSFGYQGTVLLTAEVATPKDLKEGEKADLAAKVSWLACKDRCVLGEADLRLTLPVAKEAEPVDASLFRRWSERVPQPSAMLSHKVNVAVVGAASNQGGATYTVLLQWKEPVCSVEWFPDPGPAVELKVLLDGVNRNALYSLIGFSASVLKGHKLNRDTMELVFAYVHDNGRRHGLRVDVPLAARKEATPATH